MAIKYKGGRKLVNQSRVRNRRQKQQKYNKENQLIVAERAYRYVGRSNIYQ